MAANTTQQKQISHVVEVSPQLNADGRVLVLDVV
jgi:hypothetical protein